MLTHKPYRADLCVYRRQERVQQFRDISTQTIGRYYNRSWLIRITSQRRVLWVTMPVVQPLENFKTMILWFDFSEQRLDSKHLLRCSAALFLTPNSLLHSVCALWRTPKIGAKCEPPGSGFRSLHAPNHSRISQLRGSIPSTKQETE